MGMKNRRFQSQEAGESQLTTRPCCWSRTRSVGDFERYEDREKAVRDLDGKRLEGCVVRIEVMVSTWCSLGCVTWVV